MTQVLDTLNGKTISVDTSADGKTVTFTATDGGMTTTLGTYSGAGALTVQFLAQLNGHDMFAVKEGQGYHIYTTDGSSAGTAHVADLDSFVTPPFADTSLSVLTALNGRIIVDLHEASEQYDEFWSFDGSSHLAEDLGGFLVADGHAFIADSAGGSILIRSTDPTYPDALQTDGTNANSRSNVGTAVDLSPQHVTLGGGDDNYTVPGATEHSVEGGNGNDSLVGNAHGDFLDGGAGNDSLYGHEGNDFLVGGEGDDYLHDYQGYGNYLMGGEDNDTVVGVGFLNGDDGDDYISANGEWTLPGETDQRWGGSYLDGGAGDDTLQGDTASHNTLTGGTGDDTYYVYRSDDVITENVNEGFDTVYTTTDLKLADNIEALYAFMPGMTHGFHLTANDQGDYIAGNAGDDTLEGGAGNDTLYGDGGHDSMDGGAGNDSIDAGSMDRSTLVGGDGDDILHGSGVLIGGDGDDAIIGTGGYTEVTLGAGNDRYQAANTTDPDHRYENLYFSGNIGDYTIAHDENGAGVYLVDNRPGSPDGTDYISGYVLLHFDGGPGVVADNSNSGVYAVHNSGGTYNGTAFADQLEQSAGHATIHLGAGDDVFEAYGTAVATVFGEAGDDYIIGGDYADTLSGGDGQDVLGGFGGDDSVNGGKGDDLVYGEDGNDTLMGADGADTVDGGAGNDILNGGTGNDVMHGGAGDDTYYVDSLLDVVSETNDDGSDAGGNDRVFSTVSYTLGDFVENLNLDGSGDISGIGNSLQNNLYGNNGNNFLSGMNGNDKIKGMAGDDTISGGKGNDILEGGAGADTFVFLAASANGTDRITDFEHGIDRLLFNHADYDQHALFTLGSQAVGSAAQFVWNAATETLYYDHDGAGGDAAIALATFGAGVVVSQSDLHFT